MENDLADQKAVPGSVGVKGSAQGAVNAFGGLIKRIHLGGWSFGAFLC